MQPLAVQPSLQPQTAAPRASAIAPSPVSPRQVQPQAPPSTLQRSTSSSLDDARRREREEQRRQEEERKKMLRQRSESSRSPGGVESALQELQLQEEEEVEEPEPQPVSPRQQLQTFASTKGYLASVPGFDPNLATYMPRRATESSPAAAPAPVPAPAPAPQATSPRSGLYTKTVADPSRDWRPSDDLPEQYQTGPWRCSACQTVQQAQAGKCSMCGATRPSNAEAVELPEEAGDRPFIEDWACGRCSVTNDRAGLKCTMCGNARPKFDPTVMRQKALTPKSSSTVRAVPGAKPKKKIISKSESGVELEYAKKVDMFNYKAGSTALPGHGASY